MAPPTPKTPAPAGKTPVESYFAAVRAALEGEKNKGVTLLSGTLRFCLSKDDVETIWDIDGKNGLLIEGGGSGTPDATVTMTEGDFADMLSGKLSGMSAYMSGRLKVSGNTSMAQKLEQLNEAASKYGSGWGSTPIPKKPVRPEWFDPPAPTEEVFQAWLGGKQNDCILKLPASRPVMDPPECFHTCLFEGWQPTNKQYDAWVKMYYAEKKVRSQEEMQLLFPVTAAKFEAFRKEQELQFGEDLAEWEENYGHLSEGTFAFLGDSIAGVADAVSGAATGVFDTFSSFIPSSPFK